MTAKNAKPAKAPATPKRLTEEDIRKKHPKAAIIEGTLLYVDPKNKVAKLGNRKVPEDIYTKHPHKQVVVIHTVDEHGKPDGDVRWVATSDLHHVRMTEATAKRVRLARLKEARAKRRASKPKVAKPAKQPKTGKIAKPKAKEPAAPKVKDVTPAAPAAETPAAPVTPVAEAPAAT